MSEFLTRSEIESRFKSEWVLLEDPDANEQLEIIGGRVLCHSPHRDEVYRRAREIKPKHSAFIFTGSFPKDTEFVL